MNKAYVANIMGKLLLLLAAILVIPLVVAIIREPEFENLARHVGLHLLHAVFAVLIIVCLRIPIVPAQEIAQKRRTHLLYFVRGLLLAGLVATFIYGFRFVKSEDAVMTEIYSFYITLDLCAAVGLALILFIKAESDNLGAKEGAAIVTLGWLAFGLFGALPFWFSGAIPSFIDAFFETSSGFTTTGASIFSSEMFTSVHDGLMFWRSMTHWLGGMGIIVLVVAILPSLGTGGYHLVKAELPGPTADKLKPRIRQTAMLLWLVYLVLTFSEIILLMVGQQDWFEASCHTFGTLATGGFSVWGGSIGDAVRECPGWGLYNEIVVIFFMFLAGCNFALHYSLIFRGRLLYLRDPELKFFILILVFATATITLSLMFGAYQENCPQGEVHRGFGDALRYASFQAVSITTTTGYCTADFDMWPDYCRILLLSLMFVGGCGGSTGGGMKVVRVMVLFKHAGRELIQLIRPRAIMPVRIGNSAVKGDLVRQVTGFFILFMSLFVGITLFLTAMGNDFTTSISSTAATLGNIGPGLGKISSWNNYAHFDPVSKIVLTLSMILGRLEIYTVLIIFWPRFWRE